MRSTIELPETLRRAMELRGLDPDDVAAKATEIAESGVLDRPEAAPAPKPAPASTVDDGQESLLGVMDHPLAARTTDPGNSHAASDDVAAREGTTATLNPGTHKHRILTVYGAAERPLTDTEAWTRAGIDARSGAWHRCSDLLDAGAIRFVKDVTDAETGSSVRTCAITLAGSEALAKLERGKPVSIGG
jgi:hypothetical protein